MKKQNGEFFIHAYCLMDNHVHIMLSEGTDDISRIMKRINVSYVHYFNNKYKRVGHLFQERYKSEIIEQDTYVLSLVRYIHQNPVKAGMVKKAEYYKWSSYNGYLKENDNILDTDLVLGILSDNKLKAKEIFVNFMNEKNQDTFIDINEESQLIDEDFVNKLFQTMLNEKGESATNLSDDFIKEFRNRTNLSLRKIAAITRMNKDKINQIIKS